MNTALLVTNVPAFVMCKNRKKKGARQQCDHFQWWRVPRMQQGWDAGQ